MAPPDVLSFEWDEPNAEHIAEHGITDLEVDQLLSNAHLIVPKRKRSRRMLLIGRTNGGRVLTVVIERTRHSGTWRPITAWNAASHELKALKEATK